MGHPKHRKCDDHRRGRGENTVAPNFVPGLELAHLLPPLEIDCERGDGARGQKNDNDQTDQIQASAATAACASDLGVTNVIGQRLIVATRLWLVAPTYE